VPIGDVLRQDSFVVNWANRIGCAGLRQALPKLSVEGSSPSPAPLWPSAASRCQRPRRQATAPARPLRRPPAEHLPDHVDPSRAECTASQALRLVLEPYAVGEGVDALSVRVR
jgi:hypothetical protein